MIREEKQEVLFPLQIQNWWSKKRWLLLHFFHLCSLFFPQSPVCQSSGLLKPFWAYLTLTSLNEISDCLLPWEGDPASVQPLHHQSIGKFWEKLFSYLQLVSELFNNCKLQNWSFKNEGRTQRKVPFTSPCGPWHQPLPRGERAAKATFVPFPCCTFIDMLPWLLRLLCVHLFLCWQVTFSWKSAAAPGKLKAKAKTSTTNVFICVCWKCQCMQVGCKAEIGSGKCSFHDMLTFFWSTEEYIYYLNPIFCSTLIDKPKL